jgi:hypothetical protein
MEGSRINAAKVFLAPVRLSGKLERRAAIAPEMVANDTHNSWH